MQILKPIVYLFVSFCPYLHVCYHIVLYGWTVQCMARPHLCHWATGTFIPSPEPFRQLHLSNSVPPLASFRHHLDFWNANLKDFKVMCTPRHCSRRDVVRVSLPDRLNWGQTCLQSHCCPHCAWRTLRSPFQGVLDVSVIDWLPHQSRRDDGCDAANPGRDRAGTGASVRQSRWVMLGPPWSGRIRSGHRSLGITLNEFAINSSTYITASNSVSALFSELLFYFPSRGHA